MMQDNRLKLTHISIREFGSIGSFEGNLSDIVLIESGMNSSKIEDILYVIRDFMNIGLVIEEGQDLQNDFVAHFVEKFNKRTYIEIGFTFDEHPFYYRDFYDIDGKRETYVRDVQSRFTMRGELCYSFMTYIMNPYAMNIACITSYTGEGNEASNMPDELSRIWKNIKGYELIRGITNVLDIDKADYARIASDFETRYGGGFNLPYGMSTDLCNNGMRCYVDGEFVHDIKYTSRKEQKAYYFACYILANEVVSRASAIESMALINGPMILDMELYWDMEDDDAIGLIKRYLLTLGRQVFIVEAPNITKALWQDNSIKSATLITDGNDGFECITRALN